MKCQCGCGQALGQVCPATAWRIKQGYRAGYLPGHHARGKHNVNWNGGRATNADGYILVLCPSHPNSRPTGYILEQRLVMAQHLGRVLLPNELVHHINQNRTDNRIENLVLITRSGHARRHWTIDGHPPSWKGGKKLIVCASCGKSFVAAGCAHYRKFTKFCSIQCRGKYQVGENAPHSKLSDKQVAKIRALAGKLTHRDIAKRFGIGKTQVGRIIRDESRCFH